ncbi:MAG: glucosamine-6-phosphate deaminase [Defluviitaleaceae bacterium]|nr:glucosamine-6-phosphate deaminase [Defluviitaleaceae bacterium]
MLKIIITKDFAEMSQKAAELVAAKIKAKPDCKLGLATGGTPAKMYELLVAMHRDAGLDFAGITGFNLDEYYPIAQSSDQSYHYYMQQQLYSHVNVKPANQHIPNGAAKDVTAECDRYEALIEACGGIDLQILGIGNNAHIGFNEPAGSFSAKTQHIQLDEMTIQSNARYFANASEVPRHAITMGIRTIMMAKQIVLLASGQAKAEALRASFKGPITPAVPASALQLHHDVVVIADEAAGVGLI